MRNRLRIRFFRGRLTTCTLLLGCLSLAHSWADTVTLTPVADAGIMRNSPDANLGTVSPVVVGALGISSGSDVRRALFRFPSGQIPPGSTINSVTVRIV